MILCTALAAALATATPGSVIAVTGTCPATTIAPATFKPAVTIDARAARFAGTLTLDHVSGLAINGGTYGPIAYKAGSAITILASSFVTVQHARIADVDRGIKIGPGSFDVLIARNRFDRMRVDGVDITARRVTVDRNVFTGSTQSGLEHPDCIQGWSRPDAIVADVTVTNNSCTGHTQGISFFNHIRAGIDDGGFDRITIRGNAVNVTESNGIGVADCRDCIVEGNTLPMTDRHINRITVWRPVRWTPGVNAAAVGIMP